MSKNKSIHFIGISGTAMASLARAFKVAGFKITGSEAEHVFPPMSTYLAKNKIKYYSPFNDKKVGQPNEIVVGNAHYSDTNPEVIYARKNKIELEHFPRLIEKYLIKKKSIVVTGTYGKTSTAAMLAWLLDKAGQEPNYMLGGIPINLKHGASLTNSNWSVVEGDEYPAASPWDFSPKFDFYQPKYLLLSSAEWDHMDIYKTKKSYIDVFKKLVARVPKNGLIIAKKDGENLEEVLKNAKCKVIYYYSCHSDANRNPETLKTVKLPGSRVEHGMTNEFYFIDEVKVKGKITEFVLKKYVPSFVIHTQMGIQKKTKKNRVTDQAEDDIATIGKFQTQLLGEFNLENWCAALSMAIELGTPIKILQSAVRQFKGVKRRLEIRQQKNGITIIDDFAHNPSKAKESVLALKKHFPQNKIYVIFEPNRGGRSINCLQNYNNVFNGIDKIFIPKLSNYKPKEGVVDVSGKELAKYLRKTHKNVVYEENNEKILAWLKNHAKPGTVIAFLGSRDFGGMLEKIIKQVLYIDKK